MNTQTLNQQQCDACRADAPRVTEQEANELQQQIPDWERVELDGVLHCGGYSG